MNDFFSQLGKRARGKPKNFTPAYRQVLAERVKAARESKRQKRLASKSAPSILPGT
jgi:hypothetical protein